MSRLTRDATAEPVSRVQILRRERGQGDIHFPCSADHVQDWQPYPVDPYSCYMRDHTYTICISVMRRNDETAQGYFFAVLILFNKNLHRIDTSINTVY